MQNHQAIKDNIRRGDFLLSRPSDFPMVEKVDGVVKTVWTNVHLCLGNGWIQDGLDRITVDDYVNDEYQVAVFRLRDPLTEKQERKVTKRLKRKLFWLRVKRVLHRLLFRSFALPENNVILASVFNDAGVQLGKEKMQPGEFDESAATVRIV